MTRKPHTEAQHAEYLAKLSYMYCEFWLEAHALEAVRYITQDRLLTGDDARRLSDAVLDAHHHAVSKDEDWT